MKRETALHDENIPTPNAEQSGMPYLSVVNWSYNRDEILSHILSENAGLRVELNDSNKRIEELEAENKELKAENIGLKAENIGLKAENQKLFEQAHLDCQTSDIPTGMDWKKGKSVPEEPDNTIDLNAEQDGRKDGKEEPISVSGYLRNKDGQKKRPGGQKKHSPSFMRVNGAQDGDPVKHYPNKCMNCPNFGRCIEEGRFRQHNTAHEYDIEVSLIHREHQLFEATDCLSDGSQIRDELPEEIVGTQYYGENVQLHVLTWHHLFHGSYDRVAQAAKELFGLSLSAGTAYSIVRRASAKILGSGFMDALRFFILLYETVLGVDETSASVGGRNAWVHTASTAAVTLLSAHWRRGFEGTIYAGVVQFFTKTLLSDCWATYFNEALKCKHAICDAHILRELVAAAYFRHQSWAIDMFDLLIEVFTAKRDAIERGDKCLNKEYINDIKKRYRQIVANGYNEISGQTSGKTHSLLERLRKLEDATLAFAVDFSVEFTNNVSEQSVRNIKVVLRVIGQFKTIPGLVDYCIIQSFMDTCRKQGHNPFDMLRLLMSGGDIIEVVFGTEKAGLIKQMIRLERAFEIGDTNEIDNIKAEMGTVLTDELIAAALSGRFKAYNDPPPPQKKSSSTVHKDKMKAAREKDMRKNASQSSAKMIRAGPNCA